jgi:hypothetical protein
MKTRNFKNRDFSCQFNNLTLQDIIQKSKNEEPTNRKFNNPSSIISEQTDLKNAWDKLCKTFISRMLQLDPIIPGRYLWHVSFPWLDSTDNLRNFSIVSEGLKVKYSEGYDAIFAHNRLYSISEFYPFTIDMNSFNDSFGGIPAPGSSILYADFWRIDTQAYNGKWYIDPNMKNDCFIYGNGHPINFLCTPEDVPSYALKCYQLSLDVYLQEYKRLQRAHLPLLSTTMLRPNKDVNEWLRKKQAAA